MSIFLRLRHAIPMVKPFPLSSFGKRFLEKLSVVRHSYGFGGGRVIGEDNGNLILKFNRNCEIGEKGMLVKLPKDEVIFRHVKIFGEWGGIESDFLSSEIRKLVATGIQPSKITFIDMGANVGLVSTQTLNKSPLGVRGIAIEPLPILVDALNFNLKTLSPKHYVKVLPYALGKETCKAQILINPRNFGSSSLALNEKIESESYLLEIDVLSVKQFVRTEISREDYLILKSDLESFDCVVLSAIPVDVWERVCAGVIEVTSGPNVDLSSLPELLTRLKKYHLLSWSAGMGSPISIEEVQFFWSSGIADIRNLYFSN